MRVTLAITLGLIGLEIVRFLLFLVCRLFGYSIWIFPRPWTATTRVSSAFSTR